MLATSKWLASILAIGILLTPTLTGGAKEADYTVDTITNDAPIIDYIIPSVVPSGSPSIVMYMSGHNFRNSVYTAVRLRDVDTDVIIYGLIFTDTIWVPIADYFLTTPTTYTVTVLKFNSIIPIIPCAPPDCEESNPVYFWVVDFAKIYLPIIRN